MNTMTTKLIILPILRAEAKRWWYHQTLRKQGAVTEAQRLERATIRNSVKTLRAAQKCPNAYLIVAMGGKMTHLIFADEKSSYTSVRDYHPEVWIPLCKALQIPIIDNRPIGESDNHLIAELIDIPLVRVKGEPDKPPYNGMSYAPLLYVLKEYEKRGAKVTWGRISPI